MNEINEILLLGGTFGFGILGTIVYYFARFHMFKDKNQEENLVSKEKSELEEALKPDASIKKTVSLSDALSKSRKSIWRSKSDLPLDSLESFEESLYMADLGPHTVTFLTERVGEQIKNEKFDLEKVKSIFKKEMTDIFADDAPEEKIAQLIAAEQTEPHVIAIVGVNGAGKTTTIGKLAYKFSLEGKKVMVAAGDTFRAAAENQLNIWAERTNSLIFKAPPQTKDPGAVAFQAYEKAKKENVDILLIDTAGRLHTQENLMNELEKVKRVLAKQNPDAPQDVWMILDSNTGVNALYQAEAFNKALGLTGVIMTKVDGSAKAGMALGVRQSLGVPILMLGVGEGIEDLRPFKPKDFVNSLV
jgi:fused signal recognition particle receptor